MSPAQLARLAALRERSARAHRLWRHSGLDWRSAWEKAGESPSRGRVAPDECSTAATPNAPTAALAGADLWRVVGGMDVYCTECAALHLLDGVIGPVEPYFGPDFCDCCLQGISA